LIWAVDEPQEAHNTFFTVQPYSSPRELQMYFAEHEGHITEIVVRSKTEYDSPDKWSGGSPYEQVVQHGGALVALYDVPEGTRFEHMNGFISRDLSAFEEDASGWIFMQGGETLIAVYSLAPYELVPAAEGDRRLVGNGRRNGVVVQTAALDDYGSLSSFRSAVLRLPMTTTLLPRPRVDFRTLSGDHLVTEYGAGYSVNGEAVDYEAWPLFGGPFLTADVGSRKLDIHYGPHHRVLDFETLTTTEFVAEDGE
jgi:hypothetical protein